MKNPNSKRGNTPSTSVIFESPNTLFNTSTLEVDNNSNGANSIIHECTMHRRKPLSKKEVEIQLRNRGVLKDVT